MVNMILTRLYNRAKLLFVVAMIGCLPVAVAAPAPGDAEGVVKYFVDAKSSFNDWTDNPTPAVQEWMRENYYRMQVYASYFDSRLSWYPNALEYQNSYGIKRSSSIIDAHPEWILRDANGDMLYIPFACSDGICPLYAADFGNPDYRAWWINEGKAIAAKGYLGFWVDDVNFDWRVANGNRESVRPIDPRTNQEMILADYRRYFAEFLEQFRAAVPDAEIAHNVIWYADSPYDSDPSVLRQVDAADYLNFERGITDGGIRGGDGKYGFETFLAMIDRAHSRGTNIILDDDDDVSVQARDYELAVYFLINDGGDLIGSGGDESRMTPDNFWSGYQTNMGFANGDRYRWSALFRRDFECGIVLVNQPERSSVTVDLPGTYTDLAGNAVSRVTMGASTGQVLSQEGCSSGPRPNSPSNLTVTE